MAAAGTISYSKKRAIDTGKLDEDKGLVQVGEAGINTPKRRLVKISIPR